VSPPDLRPLPLAFFARPTTLVARELLGKLLVRAGPTPIVARLTEVEAYLGPRDAASHARRGPTPRAAIMFGPPARLYVYLIYGMHHCMNVVCETDGTAGAVLLRAARVEHGPGVDDPAFLRGPGKLCAGLGITLRDKGLDLTAPGAPLFVAEDGRPPPRIARSARVGVEYAGVWARRRLRFYVPDDPSISGPRARRPAAKPGPVRPGATSARRPRG
jgi:DNA-3-methyladenine glycosylase